MQENLACEWCSPRSRVPQVRQNTTLCVKSWPAGGVCQGSGCLRRGKTPLYVGKAGLRVVFAKVPGASGAAKHHSMREKLPASGVRQSSGCLRRGKTPLYVGKAGLRVVFAEVPGASGEAKHHPMREKLTCGWCLPRARHHYILYTPRHPAASARRRISSFSVVYRPSFFMRSKYSPPAKVNLAERPSGSPSRAAA